MLICRTSTATQPKAVASGMCMRPRTRVRPASYPHCAAPPPTYPHPPVSNGSLRSASAYYSGQTIPVFRIGSHAGEVNSMLPVQRAPKHANRQTTPSRKPGGQPGNRNAWKHGLRSGASLLKQKIIRAELKALAHLSVSSGLLVSSDVRQRPLRSDQQVLLQHHRPDIAVWLNSRIREG